MEEETKITETTTDEVATTPVTDKTYTQVEIDAIISKRLDRERKEANERIKAAVTEAQKLAKMSADERLEHERQEREKTLAEREQGITKRELRAEALQQLAEKGIPKELADVLPYSDADTTNAAIVAVETAFRKAVEIAVNDRLKGTAPKVNTPTNQGDSIADEIRKSVFGK